MTDTPDKPAAPSTGEWRKWTLIKDSDVTCVLWYGPSLLADEKILVIEYSAYQNLEHAYQKVERELAAEKSNKLPDHLHELVRSENARRSRELADSKAAELCQRTLACNREIQLNEARVEIERLKGNCSECKRLWDEAENLRKSNRVMEWALEYQKTAWRKICEGSMFTPESERQAAERIIDDALVKARKIVSGS